MNKNIINNINDLIKQKVSNLLSNLNINELNIVITKIKNIVIFFLTRNNITNDKFIEHFVNDDNIYYLINLLLPYVEYGDIDQTNFNKIDELKKFTTIKYWKFVNYDYSYIDIIEKYNIIIDIIDNYSYKLCINWNIIIPFEILTNNKNKDENENNKIFFTHIDELINNSITYFIDKHEWNFSNDIVILIKKYNYWTNKMKLFEIYEHFKTNKYSDFSHKSIQTINKGLWFSNYYETIIFDLYINVKYIWWLFLEHKQKSIIEILFFDNNFVDIFSKNWKELILIKQYKDVLLLLLEIIKKNYIINKKINKKLKYYNKNKFKQINEMNEIEIFDYLIFCLNIFKNSFYFYITILNIEILTNNTLSLNDYNIHYKNLLFSSKFNLSLEKLYNISKSIIKQLYSKLKYKNKNKMFENLHYNLLWNSLSIDTKRNFLTMLEDINDTEIKQKYKINPHIFELFLEKLNKIVAYNLHFKGFLWTVNINNITNFDNVNNWTYNFINGKLYWDIKNFNDYVEQLNHFKTPFFFIFNQINIILHVYNNRVLLVWAKTGAGKSTSFIIILKYIISLINNWISNNIICTQPRINAVWNTADRINTCLGYKNDNDNLYCQYSTWADSKINPKIQNVIFIKTDGLFFGEIKNDIFLVKDINNALYNIYDLIIIDEAHEHNKNMDFTLTLLR